MSNGCSPITFMEGGTLSDVHIFNSEFVNGYIATSVLSNITLKDNVTIDDAAARALVSQICELIRECVEPILPEPPVTVVTADTPVEASTGVLPTTIVGGSTKLMGEPVIYIELGDYIVPAYAKA